MLGLVIRLCRRSKPPRGKSFNEKFRRNCSRPWAEAFPNLKLPIEDKQPKVNVPIEGQPGGGFAVHSQPTGNPGLDPATEAKIDHYAEELLGFVDKHFPHLSQTIAARIASEALKFSTHQEATTGFKKSVDFGAVQAFPQNPSSSVGTQDLHLGAANLDHSTLNQAMIANTPITPEPSGAGKILRFILTVAILGAVMYFFLFTTADSRGATNTTCFPIRRYLSTCWDYQD